MSDYRRYRVPGGTYLFTINLLERRSDYLTRHIDDLHEAVRRTRLSPSPASRGIGRILAFAGAGRRVQGECDAS